MPRNQRPSQGRNFILKITEESTGQVQRNLLRILAVTSASWSLGHGKRTLCGSPTRTAQNTPVRSRNLPWFGCAGSTLNPTQRFCE